MAPDIIGNLARKLCVLLKINLAATVVAVFVGIYQYISYAGLPPGSDVNEIMFPSDVITVAVGVAQLIVYVIVFITFLRWIYQVNKSLHNLSSEPMMFTPGWAIGWYFVPFANLYKPYQAMKEISSQCRIEENNDHALLKWWWLLFLTSEFISRLAFKLAVKANDLTSYNASNLVDVISDCIDIPLIIVTLLLVTRICTAYNQKYIVSQSAVAIIAEA